VTARVYHPYTEWEDWKAGLWRQCVAVTDDMDRAALILSSPALFANGAREMLRAWPKAAEHNLTNTEQNRRAWLGQATCCHRAGASESATRFAWWTLSTDARDAANAVADRVIADWERARAAELMLFEEPRSA
jgi:hypothetical protein